MIVYCLLLLTGLTLSTAVGVQNLFPGSKHYHYVVKTNVSTGTLDSESYWILEGRLAIIAYDNFSKARFKLDDLKASIFSRSSGYSSYDGDQAAYFLKLPWEIEYTEQGLIAGLYTNSEPVWSVNIKRALSVNFQVKTDSGSVVEETSFNASQMDFGPQAVYLAWLGRSSFSPYLSLCDVINLHCYDVILTRSWTAGSMTLTLQRHGPATPQWLVVMITSGSPPCLYKLCLNMYTVKGRTIKKYSSQQLDRSTDRAWTSVPWVKEYARDVPESIATAERVYEVDENGLNSLNMNANLQYRIGDHIFSVSSELSLYYDFETPATIVEKLNVSKVGLQYVTSNFDEPTNGIRPITQNKLKNITYEILLKIAKKGIDADNIVRNASLIHSLDFIQLLNTVSRLSYDTLIKLFGDLVLGTSYDLETARNIFLEVLPHAKSDACARFIKYLVIEEKEKVEDATLLSLIRKLPFNVANTSQRLLEDLESLTKLGLDFTQSIRHAGILSFAILVSKTAETSRIKQDYLENIVVKYFRMYSDCPQYLDRMVWLQGLCSIGYSAESYIRTIYSDSTRNRHERLWASMACVQDIHGYSVLETSLPILTDENEHIQLRVAALHSILSSDIRANDFLFIHNYITASNSNTLKRFWYSTVNSLESNKYFSGYKSVSYYIPFVAKQVRNPDSTYWATNNYIVSSGNDLGAWFQLMSVGGELAPTLAAFRVSTSGRLPFQTAVYVVAEGVSSNIFKKIYKLNTKDIQTERLAKILGDMKITLKDPEEVHIDVVIKIHDKTVFATHINQTIFESWNATYVKKSVMEFLRFGSHINQQMAYYPVQMDVYLPSELGTPIRLQSSVVAFTSVRGNLTAPPDPAQDLDWENDLHIRYQGTSVTSVSTVAPLSQSEHIVRLQRSIVAHLPIKFNVTMQPATKSIALTWLNPLAQRAGIAMHSRVQIEMISQQGREAYTVSKGNNEIDDSGIFFDCDRKISGSEVIEKYFISRFVSYDILPKQQSILNNIQQFFASPACGVIIPPSRPILGDDEVIKVMFSLGDVALEKVDRIELNFGFSLSYYSLEHKNDEVFLKVDSNTKIKSAGRNVTFQWFLYVEQPFAVNSNDKHWKLCYFQQDVSHASGDQDIAAHPASYEGHTIVTYNSGSAYEDCMNNEDSSKLSLTYTGNPKNVNGLVERSVEVNIEGVKVHKFGFLTYPSLGGGTPVAQLLGSFDKDTIHTTAFIKEKDGIASVSVNKGVEIQFEFENFAWLLDSWTAMQLMKKLGVYRECRLQESTIQTLSGNVEQLQPLQCTRNLVLADCSAKPSFVILRQQDGLKLYDVSGGNKTTTREERPYPQDGIRILSESSGVIIYKRYNESVILVPSPYMPYLCGACVGQSENIYC